MLLPTLVCPDFLVDFRDASNDVPGEDRSNSTPQAGPQFFPRFSMSPALKQSLAKPSMGLTTLRIDSD